MSKKTKALRRKHEEYVKATNVLLDIGQRAEDYYLHDIRELSRTQDEVRQRCAEVQALSDTSDLFRLAYEMGQRDLANEIVDILVPPATTTTLTLHTADSVTTSANSPKDVSWAITSPTLPPTTYVYVNGIWHRDVDGELVPLDE
jgi:hypothetical protein